MELHISLTSTAMMGTSLDPQCKNLMNLCGSRLLAPSNIAKHCGAIQRSVHVINLDPAAEYFDYPILADIRDLISLDDAMEDDTLHFGPNGGLVFCMEYFAQNLDWIDEALDDVDDDYIIFDCPGQIELYTHIPVMRQFVDHLQNLNFRVCGVFIVDAQFMIEASKFVSGVMSALSAMVTLEIPHVNVMSKIDLLSKTSKKGLEKYLEPDMSLLLNDELNSDKISQKYMKLNHSIASLIDDFSLVKFLPLDITDEDSINDVLIQIDASIQYGEDLEHKEEKEFDPDDKEQDILEKFDCEYQGNG
ncbi:hypothetical protein LSH36_655g01041 [Paralvinella palmiformis]|uniref:GPN-loop GTPase 3 n=1 Tax=Paralvinella palmiformis TaxID=53620 RepID=A0AAD9MU23_9ANNE|nr:hypothetical protein LSH36_655g01041 [Paralvinella palmiformis]